MTMPCSLPRPDCFYQDILFRGTAEDLERRSGATLAELKTWRDLGLLSFDIENNSSFREREIVEAEFVARLIKSPLAAVTVLQMLNALEKPYCYDHRTIYWHPATSSWRVRPESGWFREVDKEDFEFIAQHIDKFISDLTEARDIKELERLWRRIAQALNYLRDDNEGE